MKGRTIHLIVVKEGMVPRALQGRATDELRELGCPVVFLSCAALPEGKILDIYKIPLDGPPGGADVARIRKLFELAKSRGIDLEYLERVERGEIPPAVDRSVFDP